MELDLPPVKYRLMMVVWSKLFRLAALCLLLSAAVDLIAVDMLGPFWQDKATVQNELQGSCSQDDCFCCTPTAIPVTHVVLSPTLIVTATDPLMIADAPVVPLDPLFHPPRV
jgi:hypothetical protein